MTYLLLSVFALEYDPGLLVFLGSLKDMSGYVADDSGLCPWLYFIVDFVSLLLFIYSLLHELFFLLWFTICPWLCRSAIAYTILVLFDFYVVFFEVEIRHMLQGLLSLLLHSYLRLDQVLYLGVIERLMVLGFLLFWVVFGLLRWFADRFGAKTCIWELIFCVVI